MSKLSDNLHMLTDETIAAITGEVLRIQDEEAGEDPTVAIRSRIDSVKKKQLNILAAIEVAPESQALARRLVELEKEEHELEVELTRVQLKKAPTYPRGSRGLA